MLLVERLVESGQIVEADRGKLPDGVLCRVVYPVCNLGMLNANKRMYEAEVWEKVQENPELQEKLQKRALFGHAEHPQGSASDLQLTSHVIFEMKIDKEAGRVYQTLDVLDTPTGRIVDCLLRAQCNVGVSTRAEGELEEAQSDELGKYQRVVPDKFQYLTTDFTADPSTMNMAPIEVKRNLVQAAEAVFVDKNSKSSDKEFGLKILESLACKKDGHKCGGSGCGACTALKNYQKVENMSTRPAETKKLSEEVESVPVFPLDTLVNLKFQDTLRLTGEELEQILGEPTRMHPEDQKVPGLKSDVAIRGPEWFLNIDGRPVQVIGAWGEQETVQKVYVLTQDEKTALDFRDYVELEQSSQVEIPEPTEAKKLHTLEIRAKVQEACSNAELQAADEVIAELQKRNAAIYKRLRTVIDRRHSFAGRKQEERVVSEDPTTTQVLRIARQEYDRRVHQLDEQFVATKAEVVELTKKLQAASGQITKTASQLSSYSKKLQVAEKKVQDLQAALNEQVQVHENQIKEIASRSANALAAQQIKTYIQFKVRNSGLSLTSSSLALLERCTCEDEVDRVYEQIVDAVRSDALHQSIPDKIVKVRKEAVPTPDSLTSQVYKTVGSLMGGSS